MTARHLATAVAAAAIAIPQTGCGIQDPYDGAAPTSTATTPQSSTGATAPTPTTSGTDAPVFVAPGEVQGGQVAAPAARSTATDQRSAIRAYVTLAGNWTGTSLATQLRALRAQTTGQARQDLDASAAAAAVDPSLRTASARSVIETIGPRAGQPGWWIVVTTDRFRQAGASDTVTRLAVSLARLERQPGGSWAIAAWRPTLSNTDAGS